MSASEGARARVRAQITGEILDAARIELAAEGAAGLSLRAVARRLGMVPSGLYRYFPSRDHLLTALIVEAYEELGEVAEAAAQASGGPGARWAAVCAAVRTWAAAQPSRWALLYGSPVPGYAAPETTVAAALRVTQVVAALVREGTAPPPGLFPPATGIVGVLDPMREALLAGMSDEAVVGALLAWTSLIGMVSLELFGHYKGATTDFDATFAYAMEAAGRLAGLS
jgi:AcrR family transcriptional regulator